MRIDPSPVTAGTARAASAGPALVRDLDLALLDVLVESLSETDAHLSAGDTLPPGTIVRMRIAGAGNPLAEIVQARAGSIDVKFTAPLDPRAVARAIAAGLGATVAIPQKVAGRVPAGSAAAGRIGRPDTGTDTEAATDMATGTDIDAADRAALIPAPSLRLSAATLARADPAALPRPVTLDAGQVEAPDARLLAAFFPTAPLRPRRTIATDTISWLLIGAVLFAGLLYLLV